MNAVDTNVLLYVFDVREPGKQMKAEQLVQRLGTGVEPTVLFWQVLAELVQQLRRWQNLGILTEAGFDQNVQSARTAFPLVFPTIGVLDHALDLAKRYSLSHWDSMILGACKEAGVTTLYTEDMGAPTNIDGIQLLNPLI